MMKVLFILLSVCFFWVPEGCYAELYKWVDESGAKHFTNNLSKVPPEYQDVYALEAVVGKKIEEPAGYREGGKLWQNLCAECHFLEGAGKPSQIGLGSISWSRETMSQDSEEDVAKKLQYALDGNTSDMDKMDLLPETVLQIARYLLHSQKEMTFF